MRNKDRVNIGSRLKSQKIREKVGRKIDKVNREINTTDKKHIKKREMTESTLKEKIIKRQR